MHVKQYITVINLLLLTAISYFAVETSYLLVTNLMTCIPSGTARYNGESVEAVTNRQINRRFSYYNEIADRDLFKTKNSGKPERIEMVNLEQTELDLRLYGTITGNSDTGAAVIAETKGTRIQRTQRLYNVGDLVQNAVIKRILREKVILEVNGENEILEVRDLHRSPIKAARTARPTRQTRNIRREQIEKAVSNINNVMTQARIRPHDKGVYISGIKRRSIFRTLGLRNRDILTSVDGRQIQSVDDALRLYTSLRSAPNVTLELIRRGRTRIINYNIR